MFWIDFETKSNCDLKVKGAYNYAQDASTDVLCMAYAEDDADVQLWLPGQPFPKLRGQIRAHNASFERLIFWYVLQQNIPLENFYCTAAQARANCMPGSLEDVGRAATSKMRKDHRGAALIRQLCIPPFNNNPKLLQEFYDYCMQDVRAMRDISKSLRELSPEELADYHVNERINDRGVLVDLKLCDAAVGYSDAEVIDIQQIVREITNGEVTSVRSPKMRQWVIDRVGPEARKMMIVDGKDSIDKTVRANLLAMGEDEVPPDVADVIQCADDLWASSVAKFKRLSELSDDEDHRVRGAFVFNGGAATGRASSYGAQVHNFTRKCAKEPEKVRQAMVRGHEIVPQFGLRITDVLKGMLRPALIPAPGNVLVVADWSAIEGRVHPWLSNCPAGERKLDLFRQGLDPYIVNASALFGVDYAEVTADQRQVGKVQELALGFLGADGAFAKFSGGLNLSPSFVKRAVAVWRRTNPWAMDHGKALEAAYMRAMRNPGHEISAGRVTYVMHGEHLWYMLPSGRVLCYPYARFEADGVSYLKSAFKPKQDAKEWPRARLWRGLACENVTQATANDLLRNAMRSIPDVVLHCHDEIAVECPAAEGENVCSLVRQVMCMPPAWAAGLPLAIEVKIMERYGK